MIFSRQFETEDRQLFKLFPAGSIGRQRRFGQWPPLGGAEDRMGTDMDRR